MAEHKVPQDVEADDKLLGPLSFRQFIYAMIALGAAALAYFLSTIAIPLLVIPLPVFVVFGVLAIPRRGQPMETYIGALIHFYFQPTKRLWDPDGQDSLVEITNPPVDSTPQTKEIGGAEAARRLSFLADIEDSQGWSTRGNVNLTDDYALAANTAAGVFDDSSLDEEFTAKLAQSEQQVRDEAIARMNTAIVTPAVESSGFAPPAYTSPAPAPAPAAPLVTPPPAAMSAPMSPPIAPASPSTAATVTPAAPTPPPAPTPAPATEYDEASLSAMLKQSAASNAMTAFQQTVVQPPVLSNPTITTTALPAAPTPTPPPPAPAPTPPSPPPATPPPAPIPPPVSTPETPPPAEPVPEPPKPDTMDKGGLETASVSAEEIISHGADANDDNLGGEISLH